MDRRPSNITQRLPADAKVFTSNRVILHPQFDYNSNQRKFDYDIALVSVFISNAKFNYFECTVKCKLILFSKLTAVFRFEKTSN